MGLCWRGRCARIEKKNFLEGWGLVWTHKAERTAETARMSTALTADLRDFLGQLDYGQAPVRGQWGLTCMLGFPRGWRLLIEEWYGAVHQRRDPTEICNGQTVSGLVCTQQKDSQRMRASGNIEEEMARKLSNLEAASRLLYVLRVPLLSYSFMVSPNCSLFWNTRGHDLPLQGGRKLRYKKLMSDPMPQP